MRKVGEYFYILCALMILLTAVSFAQEKPEIIVEDIPSISPGEEDISWVWGEIKAIDPALYTITIVYMDYQTDEEKDLALSISSDTKFEGVKDFSALAIGDTAGIDYVAAEGKNIIKSISVEKLDFNLEDLEETEGIAAEEGKI